MRVHQKAVSMTFEEVSISSKILAKALKPYRNLDHVTRYRQRWLWFLMRLFKAEPMISVEVDLIGDFEPEEPMVRYYRDGSGYPGAPACWCYTECHVTSMCTDTFELRRAENPKWFEELDKVIDDYIVAHLEDIEVECLETLAQEDYDECPY